MARKLKERLDALGKQTNELQNTLLERDAPEPVLASLIEVHKTMNELVNAACVTIETEPLLTQELILQLQDALNGFSRIFSREAPSGRVRRRMNIVGRPGVLRREIESAVYRTRGTNEIAGLESAKLAGSGTIDPGRQIETRDRDTGFHNFFDRWAEALERDKQRIVGEISTGPGHRRTTLFKDSQNLYMETVGDRTRSDWQAFIEPIAKSAANCHDCETRLTTALQKMHPRIREEIIDSCIGQRKKYGDLVGRLRQATAGTELSTSSE